MDYTNSRQNRFVLFLLAAAALILTAAAVFLFPDTPPAEVPPAASLNGPVFSHTSGFYEEAVTLRLTAPPGSVIHYTLDGTEPTTDSPVYEAPLVLEKQAEPALMMIPTTSNELFPDWGYDRYQWLPPTGSFYRHPVVRAMTVNESGDISPVTGHTYLIGSEAIPAASAVTGDPALPVILLITDPSGFFDDDEGIYVPGTLYSQWRTANPEERVLGNSPANYLQRGRDWERPGHVTFLEPGGAAAFTQNIGLRIHGGFTRAWAQKTLRLYARASYDPVNWFEHAVFPGHLRTGDNTLMNRYKRLLLRNSGNDWSHTLFRDALMHHLVADLALDSQAVRPAVVYLNGEYWGIHHLRERLDAYYLMEHYGLAEEEVVLINEADNEVEEGYTSDLEEFHQHMSRISGFVLSEEERFQLADTLMDMDHWYEYLATQLYAANTDWITNNVRVWRKRTLGFEPEAVYGHDGRWRWMLFDLDYAFDFLGYGYETHDTVAWLGETSELFEKLSRSETFRNRFLGRTADLLNTVFHPDHVQAETDRFTRILAPEMVRNIQRWPNYGDIPQWHQEIQVLHDYAAARPDYLRNHLSAYFDLTGSVDFEAVIPAAHQGRLRINTLSPEEVIRHSDHDGVFRGQIFAGIPLELEAIPAAGWQFSHWEGITGSPASTVVTLTPSQTLQVEAVFLPE